MYEMSHILWSTTLNFLLEFVVFRMKYVVFPSPVAEARDSGLGCCVPVERWVQGPADLAAAGRLHAFAAGPAQNSNN